MIHLKFKSPQSIVLVLIQALCILALGFWGTIIPNNTILIVLEIFFTLLAVWSISVLRFRINISPDIMKELPLIINGPYKIIRHPMYTSVIFITLTWWIAQPTFIGLVAWGILIIDLLFQIQYEETQLSQHFVEYKKYKTTTKRIIPFIF
jgi:protein-S-isoprenylcysteine O-methyltransferase Ste14